MMRKWIKGDRIATTPDVIAIVLDRGMLFHRHKCQSSAWIANWNIRTIDVETRAGRFFYAVPNEGTTK